MKSVLIQFVWETFRWILTLKKKSDWAKYCWYLFRAVGESFTFSNGIFFCCHFLQEISMIEFYAWLYCTPIHLVTNIEKGFMRNATGCAEKSFGLISWQVGWWLQKLAKHRGISSTFYTFYKARHFCQVRKTSETYIPWPEIGSWNFT